MRKILLSIFSICLCATVYAQDDKVYSEYISAVDEYTPAPGQFTNKLVPFEEGDDAASMAKKCTELIAGNYEEKEGLISLGAWGGYITFHFDHPVVNVKDEYDFLIVGNALETWSEPGIVMVSEDGKKWYELSGSADVDSVGMVIYDYEIIYEKVGDKQDVKWTDNKGGSGLVKRNKYHDNEYFPLWLESPLKLKGTLLPQNAYDANVSNPNLPENWIGMLLRYGYVDNYVNENTEGCSFKIDWAVDENRKFVELDAIQYVRVYTAVNQSCGWTGEVSTEICGAKELHLDKSVEYLSMKNVTDIEAVETERYNACSMRISEPEKGINIVVYSDGSIKKEIVK